LIDLIIESANLIAMARDDAPNPPSPSGPAAVASGLVQLMLSMWSLYTQESRKNGLTSQQAQLLCVAARREVGLSEMADVLRCDPSNVSRLLDRLATRGLAYRDRAEHDGRVSVVKLTDEGTALVGHFEAVLETRLNRLVADWPSYKRDAIADALARLVETIHDDIAYEASPSAA
jgi:DNA-binding MarR family transcriptional regulator